MIHRKTVFLRSQSSIWAFLLFSSLAATCLAAPKDVHGKVEQLGPFRVLRVWGTPAEMGFAHGYLLADGITATLNEDAAAIPKPQRDTYDKAKSGMIRFVDLPERAAEELQGMIQGMEAAKGRLPQLKALRRTITLNDLILRNAGDVLRAFGCSGFTAWGEKTSDLGVVTTRNFDFPIPGKKTLDAQLILVRQPTGRRQVMTVTWPGYIGAFTGVNDRGVCAFMHDGTGGRIKIPTGKQVPLSLVLADLLERGEPSAMFQETESALKNLKHYPFSYMVRVVTPQVGEQKPARVFRLDKNGLSENPTGALSCITTNHYLTPNRKPVSGAGGSTLQRYSRLAEVLAKTVTPESAWAGLKAAASPYQAFPTLHSLVVYPDRKKIDFAFAKWTHGQVEAASMSSPTTISFDQLFVSPN